MAQQKGMLVPPIWHTEIANILGLKRRDSNLSALELQQALALLRQIPAETSGLPNLDSIQINLERIARYGIAAYDAIYVELAHGTASPLVTYDRAMIRAAKGAGVTILPA